jgi:putative flippase GtrA
MPDSAHVVRYIVNGLVATALHFGALTVNLRVLEMPSAGVANLLAAVVGITASFLGSRYYVFRREEDPMLAQAARFLALYAVIAVLHGLVLFAWTDVMKLDYRVGFLVATALQVAIGYEGNRRLVFHR